MISLCEPRRIAVEGEDREALVRVASDPYRLVVHPGPFRSQPQALGLRALADHRDVGRQIEQHVDLALERHVAVPGDDPHSPCPNSVPARRDRRKNHWKIWKPTTR